MCQHVSLALPAIAPSSEPCIVASTFDLPLLFCSAPFPQSPTSQKGVQRGSVPRFPQFLAHRRNRRMCQRVSLALPAIAPSSEHRIVSSTFDFFFLFCSAPFQSLAHCRLTSSARCADRDTLGSTSQKRVQRGSAPHQSLATTAINLVQYRQRRDILRPHHLEW